MKEALLIEGSAYSAGDSYIDFWQPLGRLTEEIRASFGFVSPVWQERFQKHILEYFGERWAAQISSTLLAEDVREPLVAASRVDEKARSIERADGTSP
jgi:hypothetical protein